MEKSKTISLATSEWFYHVLLGELILEELEFIECVVTEIHMCYRHDVDILLIWFAVRKLGVNLKHKLFLNALARGSCHVGISSFCLLYLPSQTQQITPIQLYYDSWLGGIQNKNASSLPPWVANLHDTHTPTHIQVYARTGSYAHMTYTHSLGHACNGHTDVQNNRNSPHLVFS